jgi:hypothetical protein
VRLRYERFVEATPEATWRVVSDVEAYADAAPSLDATVGRGARAPLLR